MPRLRVGQDGGQVGGAEAGRDGWECWGIGAVPDGGAEMAATAEQDADAFAERDREVLGHGVAGLILWRIGRQGWMGRVGFHCGYYI